jgi:hypothetical protein
MHFTKIIVTKYGVHGNTFFPQGEYDGIEVYSAYNFDEFFGQTIVFNYRDDYYTVR